MGRVYVCNGARLTCSMGSSVSMFVVLPNRKILLDGQPQANIMDHKPMVNIMPFGLCRSLANPTVAAATAAHHGVLTPMPCIPNTSSPWLNGEKKLLLKQFPALCQDCKLTCAWAGIISIVHCGQGMGQGAFPLSKNDVEGEMRSMDRLFIKWDTNTTDVGEKVFLRVKSLDKKRTSATLNIIDSSTNETLKQVIVTLSEGEGCSEYIQIPKEWGAKIIYVIEA